MVAVKAEIQSAGLCSLWNVHMYVVSGHRKGQDHQKTTGGSGQHSCSLLSDTILALKAREKDAWGPAPAQAPKAQLHCEKALLPLPPPASQVFVRGHAVPIAVAFVPLQTGIVVPIQYLLTTHNVHGCAWVWGRGTAACSAINLGLGSSHVQVTSCQEESIRLAGGL